MFFLSQSPRVLWLKKVICWGLVVSSFSLLLNTSQNAKALDGELFHKQLRTSSFFFSFFYNLWWLCQFTRIMINPGFTEQLRHRENNRYTQRWSNPSAEEGNKSLPPLDHNIKCRTSLFFFFLMVAIKKNYFLF